MLTTAHIEPTRSAPSKMLHETHSESKTPETEFYHDNIQLEVTGKAITINEESIDTFDWDALPMDAPLSARATQMKEALQRNESVKAVVLSPDGTAAEISYSGKSTQASKILSGRPTIIGQLESIGVIIARSLDQSNCGPLNKHVLPAPLCNESYNGNYLLFSVDESGFCKDLKLSEYQKYATDNGKETERYIKEHKGQPKTIKSALSSSFSYDLTKVFIQSEIDKKSKADKISPAEAMDALVSEYVQLDSSPMNDPDYSPSEDDESGDADLDEESSGEWREELENVLDFVRERGRADAELLADRICATFYELNGVEPSLAELKNVFGKIEQDLANEAEEDLESEMNGDALRLAEALGANITDSLDPTELVDYSTQIVGMDLVSRAKAAFHSIHGRQPNKKEMKRSVEKLAIKLAASAIEVGSALSEREIADSYDPKNKMDQSLAREDEIEDEQFNEDHFNLKMLTTTSKSKKAKYEAYDVYFSNFDKETEQKNLLKAIDSFKMRNRREPSGEEVDAIAKFLSTDKKTNLVKFKLSVISDSDASNEEEDKAMISEKKAEKVLVTPVKKKKSAARFNVYFDDKVDKEPAFKWFERFHGRKPSQLEQAGIEQFIRTDKSELVECEFEVNSYDESKYDDDRKESDQLVKMTTSKAVKGKTFTAYALDFAEHSRESGDAKQALKWFQRFNGRMPTKEEQVAISNFVKADNEETIDID